MAIINGIDCGVHPTWLKPLQTWTGPGGGSEIGSDMVEGGQVVSYPRAGSLRKRTETVWIRPFPAIVGDFNTIQNAALALWRQLYELFNNPAAQPAYIQWQSGGGVIVADSEDGWYDLNSISPDIEFLWNGDIKTTISVTYRYPGLPNRNHAMFYSGTNALTGYTATPNVWIGLPFGSTVYPSIGTRTGAQGTVNTALISSAALTSPLHFQLDSTVADIFKGRVYVYDTVNTTNNPVPTGGSFADPDWIQVFHPDHQYFGDMVVTNGLLLLLIQATSTINLITLYYWNTTSSAWATAGSIRGNSNAGTSYKIRSFSVKRISYDEAFFIIGAGTDSGVWCLISVKLPSCAYHFRIGQRSRSEGISVVDSLFFTHNSTPKISYNPISARDNSLAADQTNMSVDTVSGDANIFRNNSDSPFIAGWLFQSSTSLNAQGSVFSGGISLGNSTPPSSSQYYGFYVIPFASPQNLQSEGESGALGTGWSSIADANASAGNTAKVASGTLSGNADLFGTSWVPPAGTYSVFFRVRVTSAASSTPQIQMGLWDTTAGAFVVSTIYAPNQSATSYAWLRAVVAATPTAGHNMQFRVVTTATLNTDWFIDEAVLVPVRLTTGATGPRDIFEQFGYDRFIKLIVI